MYHILFLILFSFINNSFAAEHPSPPLGRRYRSAPDLSIATTLVAIQEDEELTAPVLIKSPSVQIQLFSEPVTPGTSRPITLFGVVFQIRPETKKVIVTPGDFEKWLVDRTFGDKTGSDNFDALHKNPIGLLNESQELYYACVAKLIKEEIDKVEQDSKHRIGRRSFLNLASYCEEHVALQTVCRDLAFNSYSREYYRDKSERIFRNYMHPALGVLRKAGLKLPGEQKRNPAPPPYQEKDPAVSGAERALE